MSGVYISWDCNGNPVITKQSFGRDSKWVASWKEANEIIEEWYAKQSTTQGKATESNGPTEM